MQMSLEKHLKYLKQAYKGIISEKQEKRHEVCHQ